MISLPTPSAEQQAFSARVVEHIEQLIKANGESISFADYMQAALYAPGLGYYVNGKTKFGAAGDFVTSPEVSSAFSHCIAKQVQQVLAELTDAVILEFGAGTGIMAADILQYLQAQDCLPEAYWIVEVSPDLQQLQQQTLAQHCPELLTRVKWLTQLPEQPLHAVVLANEVLDAMPVERLHFDGEQCQQLTVTQQLQYRIEPSTDSLFNAAVAKLPQENFCQGYETEINLWLQPWLASISDCLAQGVVFLIDYGYPRAEYYHPERNQGTLLCHYQHHAHGDAFYFPGLQDITAHIDFTAVAEAADAVGFNVAGYCHQAAFLISCGIEQMAAPADEIKKLIMPYEMGEIFKVMALTKNISSDLMGFELLDQRGKL